MERKRRLEEGADAVPASDGPDISFGGIDLAESLRESQGPFLADEHVRSHHYIKLLVNLRLAPLQSLHADALQSREYRGQVCREDVAAEVRENQREQSGAGAELQDTQRSAVALEESSHCDRRVPHSRAR